VGKEWSTLEAIKIDWTITNKEDMKANQPKNQPTARCWENLLLGFGNILLIMF